MADIINEEAEQVAAETKAVQKSVSAGKASESSGTRSSRSAKTGKTSAGAASKTTAKTEKAASKSSKSETAASKSSKSETAASKSSKSETVSAAAEESKKIIPKDIDVSQYVTVKNGFQGKLVYKSRRTGETYVWDDFGSEQEMELRELKDAKNSHKNFYINNWLMFDDEWIPEYLGVDRYYKYCLGTEHFDDIFKEDAETVKDTLSKMSDGQRKSVAYRARVLISEGKIDSLSVISALEDALGIALIER